MKTKPAFKCSFIRSSIALFLFTLGCGFMAHKQIAEDLKDFKIKIETTDKGIKMQSLNGSAWTELSFSLPDGKPQTIDEYGMTNLDKVSTNKDANLADYLFTIIKTKKGIKLTGMEGTTWKELSFTLTKKGQHTIDQFGMTE